MLTAQVGRLSSGLDAMFLFHKHHKPAALRKQFSAAAQPVT